MMHTAGSATKWATKQPSKRPTAPDAAANGGDLEELIELGRGWVIGRLVVREWRGATRQ